MVRDYMREKGKNSKYFQNAERILRKSIEEFQANGYANTSINDICRAAGISRSTFYNIFSQKKDILIYMYERLNSEKNYRDFDPEELSNELEILWSMYKKYLILAEILGPQLLRELMQIEMNEPYGMKVAMKAKYGEWKELVQRCRMHGIMDLQNEETVAVEMVTDAVYQLTQAWCVENGGFLLQKKARQYFETGYHVLPEYRNKTIAG